MKAYSKYFTTPLAVLVFALIAFQARAESISLEPEVETKAEMEAYIDLLRKDFEVVKVDLINDAMGLTIDESTIFWPLYQVYEAERKALVNRRFSIIYDFAQTIDDMTDPIADELVQRSFGLERAQTDLKEKYYDLISEKLGSRKAARFTQAEGQLQALINFRLASEIPLID